VSETDLFFLNKAYQEALKAYELGEVPIGAVVVSNNEIISSGHNLKETSQSPCAHAELLALQKASEKTGSWRLESMTLYSTLEPCPMCAGVLLQSRIKRLVFGAHDLKWGGVVTKVKLLEPNLFNHNIEVMYHEFEPGIRLLKQFFKTLREL